MLWNLTDCFEHYDYDLSLWYLDGTRVSDRRMEYNGHPEAFEMTLRMPWGDEETICFRYPAGDPDELGKPNTDPRNLVAALNTELLAGLPLGVYEVNIDSGMWLFAVVDEETFEGDPASVTVCDEPLLKRIESPVHRSEPEYELDHEDEYGIALPDNCVTWD